MVNRCVCHNVTFEEIKQLMDDGLSLSKAIDQTQAGCRCGMCIPYIKLTVKNGNVSHQPGDIETYKSLIKDFDKENDNPFF